MLLHIILRKDSVRNPYLLCHRLEYSCHSLTLSHTVSLLSFSLLLACCCDPIGIVPVSPKGSAGHEMVELRDLASLFFDVRTLDHLWWHMCLTPTRIATDPILLNKATIS